MGYFNNLISNFEKMGGALICEDIKQDLLDMINSLGILDLDLNGAKFTWSNRHSGTELVQVKLDPGLLSSDWLADFSCNLSSLSRI